MKMLTVAGPPFAGNTSVILRLIERLDGMRAAVVKFDCLNSFDREQYEAAGIPVVVGYAGELCPDHFFVTNVQEAFDWARRKGFELLITESAGLCNRCSPHIRGVPAVCVIDTQVIDYYRALLISLHDALAELGLSSITASLGYKKEALANFLRTVYDCSVCGVILVTRDYVSLTGVLDPRIPHVWIDCNDPPEQTGH